MVWNLVGVFIVGLACGGMAFALVKATKNRVPGWLVPVSAGVGMLLLLLTINYRWYADRLDALNYQQVNFEVVETKRSSSFMRPWSYIYKPVTEFSFVDDNWKKLVVDDQKLIQFSLYTFYQEVVDRIETKFYLLNCVSAELVETDNKGQLLPESKFKQVDENNKLYTYLCR